IGVIVRTAGIDKTKAELVKDFNYLRRLWTAIEEATAHCRAPALIYQERDIVTRAIRDHFSNDIHEIIVDNKEVFDRALEFMKTFLPRHQRILQLFEEKKPLFSQFKIEDQIDTIYLHQVRLHSGGSIIIDPTEALVAIDVNSAKSTQERTAEETALRTNMEAAEEVARQLRLRDLGGIIVIDFIDMKDSKHKRQVERWLKNALKIDKARIHVGKISSLGLVELSRQRLKPAIMDRNYLLCPGCNGIGMVKSTEAKALILLRKVQSAAADGNLYMVRGHLPIDVYTYLLNKKRDELARIERECSVRLDFSLKTGFDEQVFSPECVELFTRIPDEAAAASHRPAAVRDSAILADMQKDATTGHDRALSEIDLPDNSDQPDFDPNVAEQESAAPPQVPHQTQVPERRPSGSHNDGADRPAPRPQMAPGQRPALPGSPRRVPVRTGQEGNAQHRDPNRDRQDRHRDRQDRWQDRDRGQRDQRPPQGQHPGQRGQQPFRHSQPGRQGGPPRGPSERFAGVAPGDAAASGPARDAGQPPRIDGPPANDGPESVTVISAFHPSGSPVPADHKPPTEPAGEASTTAFERSGRRRRRRRGRGGRGPGMQPSFAPGAPESLSSPSGTAEVESDPAQAQLFPRPATPPADVADSQHAAAPAAAAPADLAPRLGGHSGPAVGVLATAGPEPDDQPRLPLLQMTSGTLGAPADGQPVTVAAQEGQASMPRERSDGPDRETVQTEEGAASPEQVSRAGQPSGRARGFRPGRRPPGAHGTHPSPAVEASQQRRLHRRRRRGRGQGRGTGGAPPDQA
ncbi:MAG: Rne/Rng family ribonuclease, partial [Candidatus Wallbacteria bacterium]|nr:Rne/Rng family ribonuclease [Candidatus Wallbacteria bacterium]